ncbi:hypothetical protein PHLCEN_2v10488 [Hermanssonia centrifuga]|uniref:Uncharacterized protein n=1 Tax=Hermanssonia centrifuga TaxID=98765 RepID=A0A2R6NMF5_9APHY|nr:hypothetical protein PHLCEN_2v10488 [Hermanssonia centrifuga]
MSTRPASARRLSISSASSRVGSPQVKDTHFNESGRRPSVSSISSSLLPKDEIMASHIGGIHRDVCRSSLPANATPQAEGTRRDALFHQQSVSSSSSKSVLVHGRSLELSDRSQGHELGKSTAGPTSTPPPYSGGFIQNQEYHILPMPQQQGSESVVSTPDSKTRSSSRCSTNAQTQDSAKQLPFRRTSRPSHVPPTPAPCHSSTFEQETKHQMPSASSLVPALSSLACAPSQTLTGTVVALLHAFEALSQPPTPQEKLPVPPVTQKPLRSSPPPMHMASHNRTSTVTPSRSPKSTTSTISRSSSDSLTHETLHKDQAIQTLDNIPRTSRTKQGAVSLPVSFPSQTLTRGCGDNLRAPEEFGPVVASSRPSKTSHKRSESAQSGSHRDASLPSYAIAREGEAKCSVASTKQITTQSRPTKLSSSPPHISPHFCQNFSSHQPSSSEMLVSATTEDKTSSMEDVSWYKMKLDTEPICLRQLVGLELDEAMRLDKEREEREQAQRKGRDPRERRSKSRGKSSST